jgi:chromosome segregation ATPase
MSQPGRIDNHAERLARLETNQENIHETLRRVAEMVGELKDVSIQQDRSQQSIASLTQDVSKLKNDHMSLRQEFVNHREWWKARFWMLTALAAILITLTNLAFKLLG